MIRQAGCAVGATSPVFMPNRNDPDSGLGAATLDQLSLIAGGIEGIRIDELTSPGVVKVIINPDGAVGVGTGLYFGDGDTGWYESVDNVLRLLIGTANPVYFSGTGFTSVATTGAAFYFSGASATVPTMIPRRSDSDTGVGSAAIDTLSLIAGATEIMQLGLAGAVYLPTLGDDDTEDHLVAIDDSTGLLTKRSVASISAGVSFGSQYQIPFMNAGGTDFDYSSTFKFAGATKTAGAFYTGTDDPTNTNRLNLDAQFHVTTLYAAEDLNVDGESNLHTSTSIYHSDDDSRIVLYTQSSALGHIYFRDNSAAAYKDLAFGNISSPIMYVSGVSNRVGINETTPSVDLDVTGIGRVTDSFFVGNTTAGKFGTSYMRVSSTTASTYSVLAVGGNRSGSDFVVGDIAFLNESSSEAFKRIAYIRGARDGSDNGGRLQFNVMNSTPTVQLAMELDTNGYFYLHYIRNLTNTNYLRYNSGTGEVTYLSSSDVRLKENIELWEPDSLSFLVKQDLIKFDRIDGSSQGEIGWNANQMSDLMPDMTWLDKEGLIHFKDAHLPMHFHRAIKQLADRVKELETELEQLKN